MSIVNRGCGFRAIDFRRQIDNAQEFVRGLLLISRLPFFLFFLGFLFTADRKPPRLETDFQVLGAETRCLCIDG